MSRKKLGIILLAAVLAVIVCVILFWNSISIYIMPKAVLTAALSETYSELEERFDKSAISVLSGSLNTEGQYTAEMELSSGSTAFDMNVRIDSENQRILAEGIITADDRDLDMTMYLDPDFVAFSSQNLVKGTYYGITFDTFSADIRSFLLLSMFISDQALTQWQTSLEGLRTLVPEPKNLPDFDNLSKEDLRSLLAAALTLDSQVETVETRLNGEPISCYQISYNASGEDVAELLGYLMEIDDGDEAAMDVSFTLYQGEIIEIQIQGQAGENSIQCSLDLPTEAFGTLQLRCVISKNGEDQAFCIRQSMEQGSGSILEEWSYDDHYNLSDAAVTIAYQWDADIGEMILEGESPVTVYLQETSEGLRLETDDFSSLLGILSEDRSTSTIAFDSCTMLVSKGSDIETPSYKNLDQWSFEDLLVLLGSVGTLFGLQIG